MKKFFGVKPDGRVKVAVEKGQNHLLSLINNRYDIIMVDYETDIDRQSVGPSKGEFYRMCKSRLTERGVIAVNLIYSHPLFDEGVNALRAAFKNKAYPSGSGGTKCSDGCGLTA